MSSPCTKVMIISCLLIIYLCVLSVLSMVLKNMYYRVSTVLNIFNIYFTRKSIWLSKKSSTHLVLVLLSFIYKVIQAIEEGKNAIDVFLDFSKAFDTVENVILSNKFYHYGIRGWVLSRFKSHLSCRIQYISYNGSESKWLSVGYCKVQCWAHRFLRFTSTAVLLSANKYHTIAVFRWHQAIFQWFWCHRYPRGCQSWFDYYQRSKWIVLKHENVLLDLFISKK